MKSIQTEWSSWFKKNSSQLSGQILFDEPLARHTYYRIGGPATVFVIPKSIEDLKWLALGIKHSQCRFFIMGQGSNLLVSDFGFPGLIIRTHRINLEISDLQKVSNSNSDPLRIRTGASVIVSSLLRKAAQEGWGGLEFLSGIPGTIGGVISMNAGTHLGEAQNRLKKVEVFSLLDESQDVNMQVFEGEQLKFQYRKNFFIPPGGLIWAGEWEMRRESPQIVKSTIDITLARRKATQPIDYPSCGSVFKNPKSAGLSAWQVIDQLGLRGYRIGDAQFSEKHSNFIINLNHAKSTDVLSLIQLAKARAHAELGIHLEEEVIYLE